MTDDTLRKIQNAPRTVGVYVMKDRHERVIYVGKAKNLRTRVRSYFGGRDSRPAVPFLVARVHDIEFIVTNTEKEALILENNLIKEYRPRYNVYFRDDKDYISLRVDARESFPRFQIVRRPKKDGALYLGPYASSTSVKETLHFLQPIFPLRTCGDMEFKNRKRPCMEYEIRRCKAPCVGWIGSEEYHGLLEDAVTFLRGGGRGLLSDLRRRMSAAAERNLFEEAARLRDMIVSIERTLEKQQAASMSRKDEDVLGLCRDGATARVCIIFIRDGKLMGRKIFPAVRSGLDSSGVVSALLKQYYDEDVFFPAEILIPQAIEDRAVLEDWLTEKRGGRVRILTPVKGEKKALVEMACNNARQILEEEKIAKVDPEEILKKSLHLKNRPHRVECLAVLDEDGEYAVGAVAVFRGGVPERSLHRRFRIRTAGLDEGGKMYEASMHRFRDKKDLPDLLIVSGGKEQLNAVFAVWKELGIDGIDAIGLAAEAAGGGKGKEGDRVYLLGRKNPKGLFRYPRALQILRSLREEANRVAAADHGQVRENQDDRPHPVMTAPFEGKEEGRDR